MKKIFLLLVFLNGVLVLWSFSSNKGSDNVVRQASLYNQVEIEELVLLSEASIEEMLAKVSETKAQIKRHVDVQKPDVLKVVDVYTCYVVRPLKEKEVDELRVKLASSDIGISVSLLSESQKYWVLLPSTGNWASSLSKREEIKRKGVQDLWLLSEGESKGVISLGVYKTASSAQKRLDWLKQRSVDATVISKKNKSYEVRLKSKGILDLIKPHLAGLKKRTLKIAC